MTDRASSAPRRVDHHAQSSRPDLSLIVPTYNERENLGTLLEQTLAACERFHLTCEVIVVDDNSSDGTGAHADEWALTSAVRVLHRPAKLGLGSAVMDGFALATGDILGVIDADLSHPPPLIGALYSAMTHNNLDMVIASRYVAGGGTGSWQLRRRLLSRLGCSITRGLTPVRDAMSGFFLIRRDRVQGLTTSTRGFKIALELLVRSAPRRIAEVGYVFNDRRRGESKMTVAEGLMFLRQVVRLYWDSRRTSAVRPTYVTIGATPALKETASERGRSGN